jgi:hypothetical protein
MGADWACIRGGAHCPQVSPVIALHVIRPLSTCFKGHREQKEIFIKFSALLSSLETGRKENTVILF